MSSMEEIAKAAGLDTDGAPGEQMIRTRDASRFLDAAAAAGLGILGFDIFRTGPRGFDLDPGGTASFQRATREDNNIARSREILAAYAEEDAWVDFTFD